MTQRVLHVVESLTPEAGSVAISLAGLFRALTEVGIESKAITADGSGGSMDDAQAAKSEVGDGPRKCNTDQSPERERRVGQPRARAWGSDEHRLFARGGIAGIQRLLADVDAVHLHGWGSDLARAVASVARRAGKPYVISPLGGLSEGPYHKKGWRDRLRDMFGDQTLIRRAGAVAVLNEWERHDLQSHNVNARVTVLPYGLNVDEYESRDRTDGGESHLPGAKEGRCLLMLGPIHPVEGPVPLLKAFAEIMSAAEGWNIVIAGPERDDWSKMLDAAVRRKGATDRVRLVDAPDLASQRDWLDRADVLASPALHVRCPVSIMQAVAAGVMVIASNQGVPDGLSGVITTCGSSRNELREVLRSAIRLSDDERAVAAGKAQSIARGLFDWSVLAERYVQLYNDLR